MSKGIRLQELRRAVVSVSRWETAFRAWECGQCTNASNAGRSRGLATSRARRSSESASTTAVHPEFNAALIHHEPVPESSTGSVADPRDEAIHKAASLAFNQIPNAPWASDGQHVTLTPAIDAGHPKYGRSLKGIAIRIKALPPLANLTARAKPPPGLDFQTIIPDRTAFRLVRYPNAASCVLRYHFTACQTPTDVLRVVALTMQRRITTAQLRTMQERINKALFRSRTRASDQRICSVIRMVIKRLRMAGLTPQYELYACGLKFAARSRRLDYIRWYLTEFRVSNLPVARDLFRSLVAKLGIGSNRFGDIRNGRWSEDDLRQIILGFSGDPIPGGVHLETWLDRSSTQRMHAWLQVLAEARERDVIWREWESWRDSEMRRKGKWLRWKIDTNMANAMVNVGDMDRAWKVVMESPYIFPHMLKRSQRELMLAAMDNSEVKTFLVEGIHQHDAASEELVQTLHLAWREVLITQKLHEKVNGA